MPAPSLPKKSRGRLFVVATPIGNLEDLTFRALKTLGEVDIIACEDTRQTLKLLNRYRIKKKLISYFQPRERTQAEAILAQIQRGKDVALVSDAGTPGVSDPGFPLIRKALDAGVEVIPIPGASALTAALCAAGLPTHRFLFLGFPPPKLQASRTMLLSLAEETATLVLYLPARRLEGFLRLVRETLGDRRMVVARELTKIHEDFRRGTPLELEEHFAARPPKGEITLLVEGAVRKPRQKS